MKKNYRWLAIVVASALGTTALLAGEPTLKVGDRAPQLQTGKWVQGEAVKDFEKNKAYIVEFWATWCGPCRATIPHLNEIHKKLKDKGLVVIGQDCWERNESLVEPFIKEMGDKMSYRVALDDKSSNKQGAMAETWMAAAGRRGIPSAFLVDTKGIIAWIGHPMELREKVLEEVLAGKYDVSKAAAEYEIQQKTELAMEDLWRSIQQKKWDEAAEKLAEAEKKLPADQQQHLEESRFSIQLGKGDYASAYKTAARMSESHKDNAMFQNELAWRIATDPSIKERDLDLAETIANRANEAAHGKDAAIIDTQARVLYLKGKKDAAIALQEKAVALADAETRKALQKTLDDYRSGALSKAK